MSAWLEMLDRKTGEVQTVYAEWFFADPAYEEANLFGLKEGNFACDCNRAALFFADSDTDFPCTVAGGKSRFIVGVALVHDGRAIIIDQA